MPCLGVDKADASCDVKDMSDRTIDALCTAWIRRRDQGESVETAVAELGASDLPPSHVGIILHQGFDVRVAEGVHRCVIWRSLRDANAMAERWHGDQRYGDRPYIEHCQDVVDVLVEHGVEFPEILQAGMLHDVLEDTEAKLVDLMDLGVWVATLVDAVTGAPQGNRPQRFARIVERASRVVGADLVKVADRIANLRSSRARRPDLEAMYLREAQVFRDALYRSEPLPMDQMTPWSWADVALMKPRARLWATYDALVAT